MKKNKNRDKFEIIMELGDDGLMRTESFTKDYKKMGFSEADIDELTKIALDEDLIFFNAEDETSPYAPCHAIMVLTQLKVLKPFEALLQRLEFFYDDDYYTNAILRYLESVGDKKLEELVEFFLNESKNEYNRMLIQEALSYISKHNIELGSQIEEAFVKYLNSDEDGHDGLNAMVISDLIKISKAKHIELIRDVFYKKPVDTFFAGDLEDAEIEAGVRTKRDTKRVSLFDLFGMFDNDEEDEDKLTPYIKSEKNTKRNELCPCGSGKKYKKCCLKKENN